MEKKTKYRITQYAFGIVVLIAVGLVLTIPNDEKLLATYGLPIVPISLLLTHYLNKYEEKEEIK